MPTTTGGHLCLSKCGRTVLGFSGHTHPVDGGPPGLRSVTLQKLKTNGLKVKSLNGFVFVLKGMTCNFRGSRSK